MRIAVLDDDRQETEALEEALRGWDPTRRAECFADGAALLAAAKVQPPFTVAFIDIYLPKEDGVEIAKELAVLSPKTDIVFVTTSRDHAVEIELNTDEKFLVNCKVADLLPQLDERFLKLRRGFIVNMEYIEHMNEEGCTLRSGETVLFSRKERAFIRGSYSRWVFSRLSERG